MGQKAVADGTVRTRARGRGSIRIRSRNLNRKQMLATTSTFPPASAYCGCGRPARTDGGPVPEPNAMELSTVDCELSTQQNSQE